MRKIHGKNLIVRLGGVAIAGARSCELNIQMSEIEVSGPLQSNWLEYCSGRLGWNVNCNHLLPVSGTPLRSSVAMVGTTVELSLESGETGDILTGTALVRAWKITGTLGNLCQGGFNFLGNGALE